MTTLPVSTEPPKAPVKTTESGGDAVAVSRTQSVSKVKGDRVIFNDQYEILLSHHLTEFEHPYADVFEVIQKENRQQPCLAYVIKNHYAARLDVAKILLNRDMIGSTMLKAVGIADWTDQTQRLVIIQTKPQGEALLTVNVPRRSPLPEEALRRAILKPLCQAMHAFVQQGLAHGNIRADNVFWQTNETGDAVLGDCVSSAPGALQHPLYETIERAMAEPLGKGEPTASDDMYALGVLAAVLMRGYDPLHGKSERAILDEKISRTTFMVMTEGLQLTPRMSDFFRATLSDEPRMRWTIDQLENWLAGNRAPLKQHPIGKKATRALDFNGNKYLRARLLARDLYDNQTEAVQLIESGTLIKWLDRSLIDQNLIEGVEAAVNRASYNGKTGNYEDKLLCYVSMALDPSAPIRYKTVRAMPHSLGALLLQAIVHDQSVQPVAEIIRDKIAWFWLNNSDYVIPDASQLNKRLDHLSKVILRRNMDHGLERCLYDMLPSAPCLSPVLRSFYVLDCQQILLALDKIGNDKDRPQTIIDRHMAAFIASHDSKDTSNLINMLESDDVKKRAMSLLMLLQNLQRRYQVWQLSGLTNWLAKDAELIAQRFYNLKYRKDVVKNIQTEAKNGNLTRILALIDDPKDVIRDRDYFDRAVVVYKRLGEEHMTISQQLTTNNLFGRETGRQIAAIISAILAAIFIVGAILMHFTNGGT